MTAVTSLDDRTFIARFETHTLAPEHWNHDAHVRAAWLMLATSDTFDEALARTKAGVQGQINALLHQHQCPASYHDTITTAYCRLIGGRLRERETFARFRLRNPDLFDRESRTAILLVHYSPAVIYTANARVEFQEPDRLSLPPKPELPVRSPRRSQPNRAVRAAVRS
jgi:hypothetical protein